MIFLNSNLEKNPQFIRGKGPFLIDRMDNLVFDTWLGSGTLIFGHDDYLKPFEKMLPNGPELTTGLIEDLHNCVDFEIAAIGFQTSGSSAVSRAIRLARASTKKNTIIVIGSFWHGSENEFLFKNNKSKVSSGLTPNSHTDVAWYPSLTEALDQIDFDKTAGILIEPFQGADPGKHLLENLPFYWRDQLRKNNVLLICDEIITGFRERYGSCNISRSADPDIVIFGKAIGGGFPVGAVLLNAKVLRKYDVPLPFWGGTFSASPVQLKAVEIALNKMKSLDYNFLKENLSALITVIEEYTFAAGLCIKTGCNFARIATQSEVTARSFVKKNDHFESLRLKLIDKEGIFVGHNGLIFPSTYQYTKNSNFQEY